MSSLAIKGNGFQSKLLWTAVIALGAVSFGIVALSRGESVNAAWLVIAAVCIYFIAYRFYALFIAEKVLGADPTRQTPAFRHNDGLDFVPTNRYVLFGHHFAAIAGAGPLVGPVLAASPDRARFVCLDGIHMTEPYHRLMAKQWLAFLAGARGPAATAR